MRRDADFVRDGECANGDGRPICPPSAILCRECLDALDAKWKKLDGLFKSAPATDTQGVCPECGPGAPGWAAVADRHGEAEQAQCRTCWERSQPPTGAEGVADG